MKTVYFIRHGQSHANRSWYVQQTSDTPLSRRGLQQATEAGSYLKHYGAVVIISSTYARARSTAEAIAKETGLPVEYSDLFIERRRPGIQLKKRKLHPRWLWAQFKLALFSRRDAYRYSDEETPTDLLERARAALDLLAARPEERLIVVTHGNFMRALYAHIILGESVTARAYLALARTLRMRNARVMAAAHDDKHGWSIRAWDARARELGTSQPSS